MRKIFETLAWTIVLIVVAVALAANVRFTLYPPPHAQGTVTELLKR